MSVPRVRRYPHRPIVRKIDRASVAGFVTSSVTVDVDPAPFSLSALPRPLPVSQGEPT